MRDLHRIASYLLLCATFLVTVGASRAPAMTLTGALVYSSDANATPAGVVWHTASPGEGRPLGCFPWSPQAVHGDWPLANRSDGEIDPPLLVGVHLIDLLWQYDLGRFPTNMVMNLYFNGDNLNPGISVLMPYARGLTQFQQNPSPISEM